MSLSKTKNPADGWGYVGRERENQKKKNLTKEKLKKNRVKIKNPIFKKIYFLGFIAHFFFPTR